MAAVTMDPDRVRAYLQVACAGLGFDIGEVWWTSNDRGSSTVATIEQSNPSGEKQLRFVQLYTSKSYEDRRSMLVAPEDREHDLETDDGSNRKRHALSPQLVNAISQSAQVLWANSQETEGLIGRSDMRLQTAVGMPVAMDANGNMCVVVMFSPNHIQNTEDAMEYLQSISLSATSSKIPCLLPVFNKDMHAVIPANQSQSGSLALGNGTTASVVALGYGTSIDLQSDVALAPKDPYGIPMLPSFAQVGGTTARVEPSSGIDAFDDASYGVWNTIMDSNTSAICNVEKATMPNSQRERMEEFLTAFLAMSVFDAADIWLPSRDGMKHVVTVLANDAGSLRAFKEASEGIVISNLSGAVGRAHASKNPVWSHNRETIMDKERKGAFEDAGIVTSLAVPVANCVLCCYSLVRTDPVPFVMRFLQQALKLLWDGLDNVSQPQVEHSIWKDVEPADLGEMAADLEMHHEFIRKKRPFERISDDDANRDRSESLSLQMDSLDGHVSPRAPLSSNSQFSIEQVFGDNGSYHTAEQGQASIIHHPPNASVNVLHNHLQDAVRAVSDMVPWSTNEGPAKRAHFMSSAGGDVGTPTFDLSSGSTLVMFPDQQPSTTTNYLGQPQPFSESVQMSNNGQASAPFCQPVFDASSGMFGSERQLSQPAPPDVPVPLWMPQPLPSRIIQTSVPPQTQLPFTGGMQSIHHEVHEMPAITTYEAGLPTLAMAMSPADAQLQTNHAGNDGVKACRIQGCDAPAVNRRPYCARHTGNRLCEHPACSKCAQGSTRFCIAHGGGRRCTFPGCDKGARDKFFCAAHGGGKRCSEINCTKSAVGGSNLCTSHGGGRRCGADGCDKSAQSSTKFCVKHGGGKKCAYGGCVKVARGRTLYCAAHGGGIRCKLSGCNRVAIGKLQLCRSHGGGVKTKGVVIENMTLSGNI